MDQIQHKQPNNVTGSILILLNSLYSIATEGIPKRGKCLKPHKALWYCCQQKHDLQFPSSSDVWKTGLEQSETLCMDIFISEHLMTGNSH